MEDNEKMGFHMSLIQNEIKEGWRLPEVCINCRYCVESNSGRYLCHYMPPSSIALDKDGGLLASRFPKVRPELFCGKWERLTDAQVKERGVEYDPGLITPLQEGK